MALHSHKTFGWVVVIEFAGNFQDDGALVSERIKAGPPVVVAAAARGAASGGAGKAPDVKTQWKLGKCGGCGEEILGGSVVEIKGAKWHKACFKCCECDTSLVGVPYVARKPPKRGFLCKPKEGGGCAEKDGKIVGKSSSGSSKSSGGGKKVAGTKDALKGKAAGAPRSMAASHKAMVDMSDAYGALGL